MEAPVIDIIESVTSQELKLNYVCKTSHVNYSISDMTGNIIQNGNYDCLIDSTVPIHGLSPGVYLLCIIDGDAFYKNRFRKN
ncbi:MAG: hypothetical protein ACT4ON_06525 [Bacteroidota bacterium]